MKLSPSYMIDLINKIENALWNKFNVSKYVKVKQYLQRWQETVFENSFDEIYNFNIIYQRESDNINLTETLNGIKDDELLLKIAIDLDIEVPNVIYSIPEIKNFIFDNYKDAHVIFEDAIKNIYDSPDTSVLMANSALEAIIKKICSDTSIEPCNNNDTLYDLTQHIFKIFKFFPDANLDKNIRNIGSGLLKVCQSIESIRSNNTKGHGKLKEEYLIDDPLYAKFLVNAVTSIGLFLINYYEKKYLDNNIIQDSYNENSVIDDPWEEKK